MHARAIDLAGRRHPDDAIGGRFSLYHAAALALARQSAGISAFDDADVNDSDLRTLRDLMVIESDSSLSPCAARVRIEFKDGTCVERAIEEPSGNPARPLSDGQLRENSSSLHCAPSTKDRHRRFSMSVCRWQTVLMSRICADIGRRYSA